MVTLTPEEVQILMPEYAKYLDKWREGYGNPMSFDDWWRDAADAAKDRAKYQD